LWAEKFYFTLTIRERWSDLPYRFDTQYPFLTAPKKGQYACGSLYFVLTRFFSASPLASLNSVKLFEHCGRRPQTHGPPQLYLNFSLSPLPSLGRDEISSSPLSCRTRPGGVVNCFRSSRTQGAAYSLRLRSVL